MYNFFFYDYDYCMIYDMIMMSCFGLRSPLMPYASIFDSCCPISLRVRGVRDLPALE